MKVLSIVCQKGGSAKTTTAINLAVEAVRRGLEVALIDLDPQVSACDWKDIRGDKPPVVAATPVPHLERALKAARDAGADLAIVDTAGRANDTASAAARVADLVLIPLQPSLADLNTVAATLDIIRLAGGKPHGRCSPAFAQRGTGTRKRPHGSPARGWKSAPSPSVSALSTRMPTLWAWVCRKPSQAARPPRKYSKYTTIHAVL